MSEFDQETLRRRHDCKEVAVRNHKASRKRRHDLGCGFQSYVLCVGPKGAGIERL